MRNFAAGVIGTADDGTATTPLHRFEERTLEGVMEFANHSWPFDGVYTHVVSLSQDSATNNSDAMYDEMVSMMHIKPDVLKMLVPKRDALSSCTDFPASIPPGAQNTLVRYCQDVRRWLYLDSDTLLADRNVNSWRFKDDDPSVLSAEARRRRKTSTARHLDSEILRGVVAEDNLSRGRQRSWTSGNILYHLLDLLAHDDIVMVPELNSQRDLGPFLYQDLLNQTIFPDDDESGRLFKSGTGPYTFCFPFERQFNTGLIGFRGGGLLHDPPLISETRKHNGTSPSFDSRVFDLFDDWSRVHQRVDAA